MKVSIVLLLTGILATVRLAADKPLAWPQFRGPNGSGVADGQMRKNSDTKGVEMHELTPGIG